MRAYGVPRICDDHAVDDDCAGLRYTGAKASAGNLPGKGGDIHPNTRSASAKAAARRLFAKAERLSAKKAIKDSLKDI